MSFRDNVSQKLIFRPVLFLVSNYKTEANSLLPAPQSKKYPPGVTREGEPATSSSLPSPPGPLPGQTPASGGELQKLNSDPEAFFLFLKAKCIQLERGVSAILSLPRVQEKIMVKPSKRGFELKSARDRP